MGQIFYIPHGGGPLPLLGDPGYARLSMMLRSLNPKIAGCKAIILVTAHWEGEQPRLSSASHPELLYDYYGFPDAAYQLTYAAPGAPELAEAVKNKLVTKGFDPTLDPDRGFDHGTFVPMTLIRSEADIPILQMSLLSSLDPVQHLLMGKAIAELLQQEIVLIGSGFSFHNIAALTGRMADELSEAQALAEDFHSWLDDVICDPDLQPKQREQSLISWADAPGARFCHPREEHLLPLHVCCGAALESGVAAHRIFSEPVKGFQTSGYHWH
ncbi:MAG: dioxygenase [Rhodospirillales bacterium]|nr:dioxygenase [Rhodospirillales bacterium]